jgi:hypothetical protein
MLRMEFPDLNIVNGDYGLRGPTTTEIRSKYTNGKIRHTIEKQIFVVRGHPFLNDHSFVQMHELAERLTKSRHYLGDGFSWGDSQILLCSLGLAKGDLSHWIAVDTSHHLTFVVQEVEEFERVFSRTTGRQRV